MTLAAGQRQRTQPRHEQVSEARRSSRSARSAGHAVTLRSGCISKPLRASATRVSTTLCDRRRPARAFLVLRRRRRRRPYPADRRIASVRPAHPGSGRREWHGRRGCRCQAAPLGAVPAGSGGDRPGRRCLPVPSVHRSHCDLAAPGQHAPDDGPARYRGAGRLRRHRVRPVPGSTGDSQRPGIGELSPRCAPQPVGGRSGVTTRTHPQRRGHLAEARPRSPCHRGRGRPGRCGLPAAGRPVRRGP